MYKEIAMYQTADGRTYAGPIDAVKHVETVIHDAFMRALPITGNVTQADRIKIVEYLYKNREDIRAALKFEEYGNDE